MEEDEDFVYKSKEQIMEELQHYLDLGEVDLAKEKLEQLKRKLEEEELEELEWG